MARRQTIAKDGVEVYRGFRIRERRLKTCTRYVIDYRADGQRHRLEFPTISQARGHCEQLAMDRDRLGTAARLLTDDERLHAAEAISILEGTGATLVDAARAYVAANQLQEETGISFEQLVSDFLEWMQTTQVKLSARSPGPYRPDTINGTRTQLQRITQDLGPMDAGTIDKDTVRTWLDSQQFGSSNWDHYRRAISMLYSWAIRQGGQLEGRSNPAAGLRPPAAPRKLPEIFTPPTVASVMEWIEGNRADLVPYFATGFFAGLRPEERRRVTYRDIDFETGEILVTADASKTHGDRLVTMPDNLANWLKAYPLSPGSPLGPSQSTVTRVRAKMRGKLDLAWPVDVARHCFATYHCALHGMDATAEQLGHSSTAMLHRHYRGLARNRKRAAEAFFGIIPG